MVVLTILLNLVTALRLASTTSKPIANYLPQNLHRNLPKKPLQLTASSSAPTITPHLLPSIFVLYQHSPIILIIHTSKVLLPPLLLPLRTPTPRSPPSPSLPPTPPLPLFRRRSHKRKINTNNLIEQPSPMRAFNSSSRLFLRRIFNKCITL